MLTPDALARNVQTLVSDRASDAAAREPLRAGYALGQVHARLDAPGQALIAELAAWLASGSKAAVCAGLLARLRERAGRAPYFPIGTYMQRGWIVPFEGRGDIAARLHTTLRSDARDALHDHPWASVSFVLDGGYWEVVPGEFSQRALASLRGACLGAAAGTHRRLARSIERLDGEQLGRADAAAVKELAKQGVHWRGPGSIVERSAASLHRLVIPTAAPTPSATSLFVMGPKVREWGFDDGQGWQDHRQVLGLA